MNTEQLSATVPVDPALDAPTELSNEGSGIAAMTGIRIPREARDGLLRAWLDILRERHAGVAWVVVSDQAETIR